MSQPQQLEVKVNLLNFQESEGKLELSAYVFSKSGKLLAEQALLMDDSQPGTARTEFALDTKWENAVVKVGPTINEAQDLSNYSPTVKKISLRPSAGKLLEFTIEKQYWTLWLFKAYLVTGKVVKLVDGQELPVPFGDVDIFDVDLRFILDLDDIIIERIRDALIDVIIDPPPFIPPPDPIETYKPSWWKDDYCGTPTGPRPKRPEPFDIEKALADLPGEWAFSRERLARLSHVKPELTKKLGAMAIEDRSAWLSREGFDGVKISSLLYSNTAQFRKILVEKFQCFRYWLCWYPWIYWLWWPFMRYSLEPLGTTELHPDGTFSRIIWLRWNRHDIPDLWFKVRQQVNGVDRVIYARYPVLCNTRWNHPSGDPVRLVVTDAQAIASFPGQHESEDPAWWVCPLAIGNYSLKDVYGTGADAGSIGPDDPKIGLYKSINTHLGGGLEVFKDGPFGGLLGIRILFSSGLEDAGVKYYRVKYRVNGSGDWMFTTREVMRHYSHYKPATGVLQFLPYRLGPKSIGGNANCFEICPHNPPEAGSDWYVIDATVDLISAYIDTSPLSNGYLDIKLELFDTDGVQVNPADFQTTGIKFKLPANTDILSAIDNVDASTVNSSLICTDPEGTFQVFMFKLQFDNRIPTAYIDRPVVQPSGNTINDCGIVLFEPGDKTIDLPYQARHPGGFAMYSFKLTRNTTTILDFSGKAGKMDNTGEFMVNELLHSPGSDSKALLNSCPDAAAFSINLNMWNMAYNGWGRIGQDTGAVRAFALVRHLAPIIIRPDEYPFVKTTACE